MLINTGAPIHSTIIHVNTLDGTVNLANGNYGGAQQGNLTVADSGYAGTVNIAEAPVSGAGATAPAKDTSGFGKNAGNPVV